MTRVLNKFFNLVNLTFFKTSKTMSIFLCIEGSKEHAIMIAYTSAGMLYQLIKACEKNKLRSCQYKDLYHCRSNTCYTLDPLVPLRLIRTFFSSSVAARTIYQKLLNQHNREIGWEVSILIKKTNFSLRGSRSFIV